MSIFERVSETIKINKAVREAGGYQICNCYS